MSVKIVHLADVHIGFLGGDKRYAVRRRAEVIQSFLSAVEFAKEKEADLLLIAGDLFDSHKIGEDTLKQVFGAFGTFSGRVFITTGNHDYYGENTFWSRDDIPENVYIFKEDGAVALPDLKVRIYGNAFTGAYRKTAPLWNRVEDNNFINIGVIHGDFGADSDYCPCGEGYIKNSGMDYVALGHIHKRSEVLKAGNTYYAYSGCLEGQGFDETGDKGFYFGTVDKGTADLEFISACHRKFIEEAVDISGISQRGEVADVILHKIKEKYGEEGVGWLYKIVLTGETSLNLSVAEIATALERELYYAKVKDKTKAPLGDLKGIADENSIRGIFTGKILEKMEQNGGEEMENALRLGLRALFEEVAFDED